MRVALLTDGIWPYVLGGMQKHSYYLCKYLAQQGVQVDVYHFNDSKYDIHALEFFSEEEKKNIQSYLLEFPKGKSFPGHYIWKNYQYSKLVFKQLEAKLQLYDFIYTKGFTGWYLINQKKKGKITCAPIGVKFHGYEMFQVSPNFKTKLQHIFLLRPWVKYISKQADNVFSYGGKITDIIKSIGVTEKQIIELPSGVENNQLKSEIKPTTNPIQFVYMGRYERRKGVEELNGALQQLRIKSNVEFVFHFLGPIPKEKQLPDKRFIYHGEIRDRTLLNATLSKADVLVCPSWSEGMPNVILEAMANGLAVIATDTGATRLLVNENTGWLMASPNTDTIVATLEGVLATSLQQIDAKKQNALTHVTTNFVWEKLAMQLVKQLSSC
jgi:glycosyltransferase involved in cell wall biosynthesis